MPGCTLCESKYDPGGNSYQTNTCSRDANQAFDRLRRKHKSELEKLVSDDARAARVAELNVQHSLEVLKTHPAIKRAISERGLTLHGLIYDIGAGQLKIIDDVAGGCAKKTNGLWSPNYEGARIY
jgi:carbonic anhydrase